MRSWRDLTFGNAMLYMLAMVLGLVALRLVATRPIGARLLISLSILLGVAAAAVLATRWLAGESKDTIGIMLASAIVALFLVEGFLNIEGRLQREPTFPASHDKRPKTAIVAELKARAVPA